MLALVLGVLAFVSASLEPACNYTFVGDYSDVVMEISVHTNGTTSLIVPTANNGLGLSFPMETTFIVTEDGVLNMEFYVYMEFLDGVIIDCLTEPTLVMISQNAEENADGVHIIMEASSIVCADFITYIDLLTGYPYSCVPLGDEQCDFSATCPHSTDSSDDSQDATLALISTTCGVFSLLAACCMIATYLWIPVLRHSVAFELVFLLAVSDFGYSFGVVLGDQTEQNVCKLQGFVLEYFAVTSLWWTCAIAYVLHMTLLRTPRLSGQDLKGQVRGMNISIWGSALVMAGLVWMTDSYGPSSGWCWIIDSGAGWYWRLFAFYLPLWTGMVYLAWVYLSVFKQMDQAAMAMKAKVLAYPLILFLCYIFATANRINQFFGQDSFLLAVLHLLGIRLRRFINVVVYGMNPVVRQAIAGACWGSPATDKLELQ